MLKRSCLLVFLGFLGFKLYAREPAVPSCITFAGMQLAITNEAKHAISKKIDCLVRSPRHYKEIFDRVNLYMPFIEKVIKEEGLPDDFKYLAIQESRLVADEISSSNAVGFWQMKKAGASEVGVRMDAYIDERMHIIAATRGFARYVKSHQAHFKNWLYALLAFHLGRTGVKPYIDEKYLGAKAMKIDEDTHWYVHHFLAHKLVFEQAIGKELHPALRLYECHTCQGYSLEDLSRHFGVSKAMLREYNKWLKPGKVPADVTCPVLIPLTHQQYAQLARLSVKGSMDSEKINYAAYAAKAKAFPVVIKRTVKLGKEKKVVTCFNGIPGIIARTGDGWEKLAKQGKLTIKQFLAINDLTEKARVQVGQVYYFKNKKKKAGIHYHIASSGETWWTIAQKYGITKSALLEKNRLRQEASLQPGRVVWLRFVRPANIPIAYEQPLTNTAAPSLNP
jgi:membrane-bound lytic murein transglycosylase D